MRVPHLPSITCIGALWLFAAVVQAQPLPSSSPKKPPTPRTELDRQLFQDLDAAAPAKAKPKPPAAGEDLGQKSSREEAPWAEIGRQMRRVESRLRQRDTSAETRQLQDSIARGLERMIDEQQRRQGTSQPKRQPASAQPKQSRQSPDKAGDTSPASTPGGPGRPGASKETVSDDEMARGAQSVWGVLPDRVRQQIQSLGNEEFLPEYAELIRQYYGRLSERGGNKP